MLAADIKATLDTCGMPVAYRFFPEGDAPQLPFVVWYIDSETNFPADGLNYHNIKHVTVELYTKLKSFHCEDAVEGALSTLGIWSKTEEYLDSENCYQIVYYLEV